MERSAHRVVCLAAASTDLRPSVEGGQTSSGMMTSAPSPCWCSTAASGVNVWMLPSTWDLKTMASWVIFLRWRRLKP